MDQNNHDLIALALDLKPGKAPRGATLIDDLFENSPHSGRHKPGVIKARVVLAARLLETLHRSEIDDTLNGAPALAAQVIRLLDELEADALCIRAECERAVQGGTAL